MGFVSIISQGDPPWCRFSCFYLLIYKRIEIDYFSFLSILVKIRLAYLLRCLFRYDQNNFFAKKHLLVRINQKFSSGYGVYVYIITQYIIGYHLNLVFCIVFWIEIYTDVSRKIWIRSNRFCLQRYRFKEFSLFYLFILRAHVVMLQRKWVCATRVTHSPVYRTLTKHLLLLSLILWWVINIWRRWKLTSRWVISGNKMAFLEAGTRHIFLLYARTWGTYRPGSVMGSAIYAGHSRISSTPSHFISYIHIHDVTTKVQVTTSRAYSTRRNAKKIYFAF